MITNITDTSNLAPIKEPVSVRLNNLHNELLANMAATAQVALTPDISAAFAQPTIQKEQSLSEALTKAGIASENNPFRNTVFVSDYNYAKKYDDERLGFSATRSFIDQEDMYADALQSGFFGGVKTLGKGVVSRGVSIIPKFLGGMGSVVGFGVDVLDGDIFKGKLNYTTDNFFNDWMDSFDEGLREVLPIYADKNYYQGGLMSKMMTGKFLADDFLDGVAFAVSSYGNVGLLSAGSKLLSGAGKLGKLGKAAAVAGEELSIAEQAVQSSNIIREAATLSAKEVVQTFVKNWKNPITNFIKNDAVKSTFKSWAKSGGYAAFNTVSEAGLEARDFKKQYKQELIEKGYSEQEANEIASEKAFDVFSGNMVALMASNIIEVRTMFPQLFNTVEGDIKAMKKAIVNGTPVAEVSLAKRMLKTVGTNIAAEGLWEENIQTSIQQYQQNSSPTDSSFMDVMAGSVTKMLSGIGYFGKSIVGGYSELTQEQKEQVDSIVLGAMVGGGMSMFGAIKEHKTLKTEQEAFNKNYNEYKTAQAQLFNILGSDLKNVYKSQTITNPDGSTKTVYSDEQGNVLYDEDKIAKLAFLNVENQKLINEYFYRITNNDKKGAEFLLDQAYARLAFQSFSNSIWDGDTDLALTDLKNKVKSLNLEESEINTLMSLANDKTEYLSELAEIFKSVQQEQLNKRIDNQADAYFNRFALAAMFYEKTKQRTFTNFLSEYQTELQELTNKYAQPKEILNEKGERVENPEYKEKTQEDLRKESYLKNQIAQLESQINESESNINMFRDDKRRKNFYKDVINNDAEQADLNKMYKEALESESEIKKEIEELYKSLQSLDINAPDYESKKEDLQKQIKDKEEEHEKLKDNTYKALEEADAKTRVEGDIKFSSNYNYETGEYRSFDEQLKKGVNEYGLKNKPYLDSFADMKLSLEFHNVLNKLLNTDLQYSDFSDISSLNFSTEEYLKTWQIIKDFLANKKDISQEDLDLIEQFYFKLRQELNSSKDSVTYLKSITKSPFEPSEQVLNHPAFALIENLVNESIDTLNDTISEYEDIEEYEDIVDVLKILVSEKTQYNDLVSDAKEIVSNIESLEKAATSLKDLSFNKDDIYNKLFNKSETPIVFGETESMSEDSKKSEKRPIQSWYATYPAAIGDRIREFKNIQLKQKLIPIIKNWIDKNIFEVGKTEKGFDSYEKMESESKLASKKSKDEFNVLVKNIIEKIKHKIDSNYEPKTYTASPSEVEEAEELAEQIVDAVLNEPNTIKNTDDVIKKIKSIFSPILKIKLPKRKSKNNTTTTKETTIEDSLKELTPIIESDSTIAETLKLAVSSPDYYKQSKLSEDFDSPSINLINSVNAQFFFDRGYIVSFLQLAKSKIESYEALADKNQYAESLNALYKIKNTLTAWKTLIKEGERATSDWFNGLSSDIENNLKELDVLIEQAKKAASNRLVNQKLNYIQNKIAQFISVGFDITNEALSINEHHFLAKYLKQPEFKDFLGKKIDELTEFDFEKITSILRTIIPAAELNSISKKIDTDITNVSKNIKLPSNIKDTFGATVLDLSSLNHPIFRTFSQTSNLYALLNDLKDSDIQSLTGIMLGTKTKDELLSIVETLIDIQLLNSVKLNLNTSFSYKNYLTELKKYEDSQQIGLSDEQKLAHLNFAKFLNSNIPLPIFMLNAVAGSGKTSTFKWLFSVSDMTAENTAFFTTTDTATETLKNSLGVNTVTTITNKSFSKIESNVEYIVIDEVSLMTARRMDQLDNLKKDRPNLKIILLGDNSQLSQSNNSIVINSDSQIAYNTPLTLAFRAKVNAISDAYNAFKNNSNTVSEVTVSASGPIGESSFGVHAINPNDSSFEKQIELEIANNSDIAIITSSDKIEQYKKKYPTVTVVTPTDSQSITKQKVFIDFSYEDYTANRLGIESFTGSDFFVKTFNKLMYTALSRASEYVMIKDYQNVFSNTQDSTLQETVLNNIEQSNQDIKNNKQQFKEWIQSELDKFENKPKEPETKPKPEQENKEKTEEPEKKEEAKPITPTETKEQTPVNKFEEHINKDTELKELIAKYPELYAILEWVFNTKGNETMNAEMYKNMVSLVYNKLTDTESSTVQSYIKQQSEC